jgi:Ca-activated chloride channel homolog
MLCLGMVVMKNINRLILLLNLHGSLFSADSLTSWRAYKAYQAHDFAKAEREYATMLLDNAYSGQNNYNLGCALYKEKKFEDAQGYFNRAEHDAGSNLALKVPALFNAGNSLVQQKKLGDAVKKYKEVLKLDPDNAPAKHNLEVVEKMLKEPPKKDEDKKQDKDKNKDKENKDKENKQDQQKSDSSNSSDNDSSEKKKENNSDKKDDAGKTENQKQQRDDASKKEQNEKQQNQKEQELEKSKEKDHKKPSDKLDKNKSSSEKQNSQKDEKDKAEPKKQDQAQMQDAYAQEMMGKPEDDDRLEKRGAMILKELDDYEKNIQKRLLQLNVTKQGVQKHGQKNW